MAVRAQAFSFLSWALILQPGPLRHGPDAFAPYSCEEERPGVKEVLYWIAKHDEISLAIAAIAVFGIFLLTRRR